MRQNLRFVQLVLLCQPQQFLIGDAAPEEERKPGGQFEIADGVDAARRGAGRLFLKPENEPRIHQNAGQRRFDSVLEAARVPAFLIKAEQRLEISVADRTPERLGRKRRQDPFGAGSFVIRSEAGKRKSCGGWVCHRGPWDSSVR